MSDARGTAKLETRRRVYYESGMEVARDSRRGSIVRTATSMLCLRAAASAETAPWRWDFPRCQIDKYYRVSSRSDWVIYRLRVNSNGAKSYWSP